MQNVQLLSQAKASGFLARDLTRYLGGIKTKKGAA